MGSVEITLGDLQMRKYIDANRLKKKMYRAHTVIAKNIRMLRILNGYTQTALCTMLNMSRTSYHSLENGARLIDYETLYALAEFYGINIDFLISFDISEQMLMLICIDRKELEAVCFMEKYFELSYCGKEQIREKITELIAYERSCHVFPWKYPPEVT